MGTKEHSWCGDRGQGTGDATKVHKLTNREGKTDTELIITVNTKVYQSANFLSFLTFFILYLKTSSHYIYLPPSLIIAIAMEILLYRASRINTRIARITARIMATR